MASPAITPSSNPAAGSQSGPAAGASPSGAAGDMATFAKVAMAAKQVTEQFPEAAQEMRQVMELVRQATMKAIQQRSAAQPAGATPQI